MALSFPTKFETSSSRSRMRRESWWWGGRIMLHSRVQPSLLLLGELWQIVSELKKGKVMKDQHIRLGLIAVINSNERFLAQQCALFLSASRLFFAWLGSKFIQWYNCGSSSFEFRICSVYVIQYLAVISWSKNGWSVSTISIQKLRYARINQTLINHILSDTRALQEDTSKCCQIN